MTPTRKKFRVYIIVNKKPIYIGTFNSEHTAAVAYKRAVKKNKYAQVWLCEQKERKAA